MNKLLFKNKGIQLGALYNNFRQRLKKASNELSYVDYVKIMDSEKALRHYCDSCFTDFINYQLSSTRKSADKDDMIKSLISDGHKYATVINNLQRRVHKLSNSQNGSNKQAVLSKVTNEAKLYEARIKHLRQRCAALKANNTDAFKAVDQYKQLFEDEKKKAETKPKVKIIKKPVVKTKTVYKSQPQSSTPQPQQSAESTSSDQQNTNEADDSSAYKNPFVGPNEVRQQSDEKAQHERAKSESNSNSDESSSTDNDVYLKARKRAENNDSNNRHATDKPKKNRKSSASQAPDLSELSNKSYSLDDDAANKAIQKAKDSIYNSDSNASASDNSGDSSSNQDEPQSSTSSNSTDSKEPSDDSSNGAPTLKM